MGERGTDQTHLSGRREIPVHVINLLLKTWQKKKAISHRQILLTTRQQSVWFLVLVSVNLVSGFDTFVKHFICFIQNQHLNGSCSQTPPADHVWMKNKQKHKWDSWGVSVPVENTVRETQTHQTLFQESQPPRADRSPASWCLHPHLCLRYMSDTERSCSHPTPAAPAQHKITSVIVTGQERTRKATISLLPSESALLTLESEPKSELESLEPNVWNRVITPAHQTTAKHHVSWRTWMSKHCRTDTQNVAVLPVPDWDLRRWRMIYYTESTESVTVLHKHRLTEQWRLFPLWSV